MVRFRAIEIAAATGGDLQGPDVEVTSVTIDSRSVSAHSLFVPVVADRDGHLFIADAVRQGAVTYLTSQAPSHVDAPAIVVNDTADALLALGRAARSRLPDRVIGITGSVGKTTVKDLTRAAMASRYTVQANARSFNNELGVPLTLANAPDETEVAVVEMGARGRGHIALLCEVARPTVGVVTAVAFAHTELFGSLDEVAVAKGELVEALLTSGVAVLNADDPLVAAMASRTRARVVTYGVDAVQTDVTATGVAMDTELRASFELRSPWGSAPVRLPVAGLHQVSNALAAATTALAVGATPDEVAAGLANASISPWRMEIKRASSGATVINDAYNANPASMEAAIRSLSALPARRRIAVLGVMAELGDAGPAEHKRIAALALDLGIELIAVDAPEYGVPVVHGVDGALAVLKLDDGDAVLVKGSRVAGLEVLASALTE
jgi:UDP-N-acetylmuramoyl-tripeptide--D-alanyl-D-alanine ligase